MRYAHIILGILSDPEWALNITSSWFSPGRSQRSKWWQYQRSTQQLPISFPVAHFRYLWATNLAWALPLYLTHVEPSLLHRASEWGRLGFKSSFHHWLAFWPQPGSSLSTSFFICQLNTWLTTSKGFARHLPKTVHLINTAGITKDKDRTWTHT